MASNPYGIAQVNVPSLLESYSGMKARRLDELYRAKQIEIERRKLERQDKIDAARAKIFAKPEGGDPASGGVGATAPQSAPTASPEPGQSMNIISPEDAARMRASMGEAGYQAWKTKHGVEESGAVHAGADGTPLPAIGLPLPPRTDGLTINQQAMQELYALDPQSAAQIQKFVYDSNEQGLKDATARGEAMAVTAQALASVPAAQRATELQNWLPYLQQRGYTPDMLRDIDLSDASLKRFYYQGRTIQKIVASAESDRNFRAQQENRERDNARADRADQRADAGLAVRREALDLAKKHEGRISAGEPGGSGDVSNLSNDALLGMAFGN